MKVIVDADFLSSLLKIDELELVKEFYRVDQLYLATAVFREVAATPLLSKVTSIGWLVIETIAHHQFPALQADERFLSLGNGEQESIMLALASEDTLLLSSDRRARHTAQQLGVRTANISAFLLACKLAGIVNKKRMGQIIHELKAKDYFEFRKAERDELLK